MMVFQGTLNLFLWLSTHCILPRLERPRTIKLTKFSVVASRGCIIRGTVVWYEGLLSHIFLEGGRTIQGLTRRHTNRG